MRVFHVLSVILVSFVLLSCSSQNLDQYADTNPALDLKEFFDGELVAYGMLENRSGVMTRRFTATIDASWEGDQGTLVEEFLFDDGEIQCRTWTLTDLGNNNYQGVASDVVGQAEGSIVGSVFQWQYQLDVPYGDDSIVLSLDDWLYLIDENHLINKTKLTKFGFRVAELTLVIEKV
jgi:hypothetical protein